MLTYCTRRRLFVKSLNELLQFSRKYRMSSRHGEGSSPTVEMMQLFQRWFFIPPEEHHAVSLLKGKSCAYGPLGVDLKRNILEQWWSSVVRTRTQVFGVSSLHGVEDKGVGEVDDQMFNQPESPKEQLLVRGRRLRSSLLPGALEQYVPSLELMNKKLPFGLAETGLCYQPEDDDDSDAIGDGGIARVVLFPPDILTVARLLDQTQTKVVEKGPSDFTACYVRDDEINNSASRGAKLLYKFPWGTETLETLWMLGDAELLRSHRGNLAKLQCKDGKRAVVPHVLSISANMDRGVLAVLLNSLQNVQKVDSKQKLHQRTVLKLHPTLAPVKVALDMGKGSTSDLRQVCEGLLQELLDVEISAWPGYRDTTQSSMDKLHTKYDEMGVLFTVMVGENTLENGLLLVRNRDTTVRETMHISEIRRFLLNYISKAENV